jgi:N-acetylglutamate synthase-like GNAT family acetyltransferase/hypoxanthine-guanine phosphoribosyltransferase
MHTIHLSEDQVSSYVRDLAKRISEWGTERPQVWATVGLSGAFLGSILVKIAPDLYKEISDELIIALDRTTGQISYPHETNTKQVVEAKRILILDGTVHSGLTLLRVMKDLENFNPSRISSYAIAVRRSARIIPNHFAFLIDDYDRVQLPTSPLLFNNRLSAYGTYRKMREEDTSRPMIDTGSDFIDRISWEDRWYEMATDPKRYIYVHEQNGSICGFVNFRCKEEGTIILDEVGVDKSCQNQKLGGHLMRWAEHYARHANFPTIELWAVDDRVDWYRKRGFESTETKPIKHSSHLFHQMKKQILLNLPHEDYPVMGM